MLRGIPERPVRFGKRWPHRFLDFLPSRQKWRYLVWKSGGNQPDPVFDLTQALTGTRRILMVLPDTVPELLLALPVVQAHFQSLPDAAIWILAGPVETPFLSSLFGRERVLTMDPAETYVGEAHFTDLEVRLQGMRPDLILNFRSPSHPLLLFLLRSSTAPLRVHLDPAVPPPFANITLAPGEPLNRLRHYDMAAKLWEGAGIKVTTKWTRLDPPAEAQGRADILLKAAGLKPRTTLLFPWQNQNEATQTALFKEFAKQGRAAGHSVALVQAEGGLFASPQPPASLAETHPCLRTDTHGTLLALFAGTLGTAGMAGPLLLLAGLTDADVTGYFGPEDAPWDTSAMNPKMRVLNLPAAE
jgi:hypothetical protein